jgi:ribosomal protein S18 acetylase RimI-like enzyme
VTKSVVGGEPSANVGSWGVRRLGPADAAGYQALHLQGFLRHPGEFRIAVEDEAALAAEAIAARLVGSFVVGGFDGKGLAGIAGLTRMEGAKLRHKALLWGMYVDDRARGRGLANELMQVMLLEADSTGVEHVLLTVVADNVRARRLYQRWGFRVYGVEPRAVRVDGRYVDEALMIRLKE